MAFVPLLIALIAVLFVVTAYELEGAELRIRRLLWATRVPLEGLTQAWHDPEAMTRSIRLWGNGGLYSVTGLFRNRRLGRYRAFVTDPARAVVFQLPKRTVVISPAASSGAPPGPSGARPRRRDPRRHLMPDLVHSDQSQHAGRPVDSPRT
jgi:hypothetical protein